MYEFDEESWDEQQAETGHLGRPLAGWLIEWKLPAADQRFTLIPRFLQIGTGQWCAAEYRPFFPKEQRQRPMQTNLGFLSPEPSESCSIASDQWRTDFNHG